MIDWLFFTGLGAEGSAFFVNGLLAPELYLEREKDYVFVVETGLGTDAEGTFHPLYFTSDNLGGFQAKSEYEASVSDSVCSFPKPLG